MARQWKRDGTHAEYWRSDNPLLISWHRFGDSELPNDMRGLEDDENAHNDISGLLVDSSIRKHDLYYWEPRVTGLRELDNRPFAVGGIAPWATGGSGMQVNWDTSTRQAIIIDPAKSAGAHGDSDFVQYITNASASDGQSWFGDASQSGICVIGWCQIPYGQRSDQHIVGASDQDTSLAGNVAWALRWSQTGDTTYELYPLVQSRSNMTFNGVDTTSTPISQGYMDSDNHPNFPRDRTEPFWVAMAFRPAPADDQSWQSSGSGLLRVMIGTEASGLCCKEEYAIKGPGLFSNPVHNSFHTAATVTPTRAPLSFGAEPHAVMSNTTDNGATSRCVNSGTIFDEFVMVNDGDMSDSRIIYYATNGMTHIDTSDVYDSNFTPVAPGSSGLVAYWDFSNYDGHNSAPGYDDRPELQLCMSGIENVDALSATVAWGEWVTLNGKPMLSIGNGANTWRAAYYLRGNSLSLTPKAWADGAYPYGPWIQALSGAPGADQPWETLYPTSDNCEEGQTILVKWAPSGDHTNSSIFEWSAPYLSWSAGTNATNSSNINGCLQYYANDTMFTNQPQHIACKQSNVPANGPFRPRFGVNSSFVKTPFFDANPYNAGILSYTGRPMLASSRRYYNRIRDINVEQHGGDSMEFHLTGATVDFVAGAMYYSKDAKYHEMTLQNWHPNSGLDVSLFNKTHSESSVNETPAFFIGNSFSFAAAPARSCIIDSIAVYNRVLTVPEQSGFMLFGIEDVVVDTPPAAKIQTHERRLAGYWPCNEFTNYDPNGVSGYRVNDYSWHSHHLTNVSGSWTSGPNLNTEQTTYSTSLQTVTSGAMISLEREFHGHQLDASDSSVYGSSGVCFGAWLQLPSDAYLDATHQIIGCWSQGTDGQAWQLGVDENRLFIRFRDSIGLNYQAISDTAPTYGSPFFVGGQLFPSGSNTRLQVVTAQAGGSEATISYAVDSFEGDGSETIQASSASGISLLNAPDLQFGFPSGTSVQHAFVYHGYRTEDDWLNYKRSQIGGAAPSEGSVSATDPATISVWDLNDTSTLVTDHGPAQNYLYLQNLDGHNLGAQSGVHGGAVQLRQAEYLTTDNVFVSDVSGLDLGSDGNSFTILGWTQINGTSLVADSKILLDKGSNADDTTQASGIRISTPNGSTNLVFRTSSSNVVEAQNGALGAEEWSHLAVTYDQDNDTMGLIVNGRYAGAYYGTLGNISPNNSGLALGGRGSAISDPVVGGGAFSGVLDDWMVFSRVLTLPEVSGIAANSYTYNDGSTDVSDFVGMYVSGVQVQAINGLLGQYLHGINQSSGVMGGHISGVKGVLDHTGGYVHGLGHVSGFHGAFTHGSLQASGVFGSYFHGMELVSGIIGSYEFGMCEALDEFDLTLTFQIVTSEEFDARLGVEKTDREEFDARLGVIQKTRRPTCTFELPYVETVETGGAPHTLTIQGSGIAYDDKDISRVRFTFADFRGAESGTLVDGIPNSGLYEVERTFDTPGWYTIKMEVVDSFGYSSTCVRPWLLVPAATTSGAYLSTLPDLELTSNLSVGSTIQRVELTHTLTNPSSTSGILEYTDFADGQESLVNSTEVPSGSTRTHDYTMPGYYCPVWAVSGSWGIVSDSTDSGVDFAP
jgi:hypothetical protein